MSASIVLAVTPGQRPAELARLSNGWGWSPSIWSRLLGGDWIHADGQLDALWHSIETLDEWQQAALVLTFDTGVIPWQAYEWAADALTEFDNKLPAPAGNVNHLPAIADVFRSRPKTPFVGVWGTTVSENPFDPWDVDADAPGSGIPLDGLYILERHRHLIGSPT